jgi:hypothetical protein
MTNFRFFRETKFFAFSRKSAEIIKRERKIKQKINKNKQFLYVDSRLIRSRSENIFSNLKKFVVDSIFENNFVVVFYFFIVFNFFVFAFLTFNFLVCAFFVFNFIKVDLIFNDINRDVFLRIIKTLIDINIIFVKLFYFVFDLSINVFIDIFYLFFYLN